MLFVFFVGKSSRGFVGFSGASGIPALGTLFPLQLHGERFRPFELENVSGEKEKGILKFGGIYFLFRLCLS